MLLCMLAPSGVRPYICLSCRSALNYRSTGASIRIARNASASRLDNSTIQTEPDNPAFRYYDPKFGDRGPEFRRYKPILSDLRKRSPRDLLEDGQRTKSWSAKLEAKSLAGRPEVLVLRDSERRRQRHQVTASEGPSGRSLSVEEIIDTIEEQKRTPGQEEINDHIESLRPKPAQLHADDLLLSQEEFDQKFKLLYDGFNLDQLSGYSLIAAGSLLLDEQGTNSTKRSPVVSSTLFVTRGKWLPLYSDLMTPTTTKRTFHKTRKGAIVENILRSLWHIIIIEETRQTGELGLKIDAKVLPLILLGDASLVAQIGQSTNTQIEVFPLQGRIKLTSQKVNCKQAADEIESVVRGYREDILDTEPFRQLRKSLPYVQSTFGAIGKTTNTIVSYSKDRKSLVIRSLSHTDAELATRMLVATTPLPGRLRKILLKNRLKDSDVAIIAPDGHSELLPFPVRQRPYGRVAVPSRIVSSTDPSPKSFGAVARPEIDPTIVTKVVNELKLTMETNLRPKNGWKKHAFAPLGWQPNFLGLLRCEVGQILHCRGTYGAEAMPVQSVAKIDQSKSTFIPMLPLGNVLMRPNLMNSLGHYRESLYVHLTPAISKDLPTVAANAFPSVQLSLLVNHLTRNIEVESIMATVDELEVGVMTPTHRMDICFTKSARVYNFDYSQQPEIRAFVRKIEDDLAGFGKIQTPPNLSLHIPHFAIKGSENVSSDTLAVQYFVTGMSFTQSLVFNYYGFELLYQLMEAGVLGGTRETISLQMGLGQLAPDQAFSDADSQASVEPLPAAALPELEQFVQEGFALLR